MAGLSVVCADPDRLDYAVARDREKQRAYGEMYRKLHVEELREQKRAWYQRRAQEPEFRAANNERSKRWAKEHTEARLAAAAPHEVEYLERGIRRSRNTRLKRDYGITCNDFDLLLTEQLGGCAICKAISVGCGSRKRLFVDHDHLTGKLRGLLCNACNRGLAHFKDNTDLLRKAVAYLEGAYSCRSKVGEL